MKHWIFLLALVIVCSCDSTETAETTPETTDKQEEKNLTGDQKIKRHIQNKLGLTAADKYDVKYFHHEITGDDSTDMIITVNLMDRALNDAFNSGRAEKAKEMGYMGYYNYFFFVDGATKDISSAMVVPSSPMYKLTVGFEEILGTGKKDFYVDSRVRNMQRRRFYSIANKQPFEMCQSVVFDNLGTSKQVGYSIQIEQGTFNEYNDIVEYEGTMEDLIIPNIDSTYSYEPTIGQTDIEVRRWHYSSSRQKYFLINQ